MSVLPDGAQPKTSRTQLNMLQKQEIAAFIIENQKKGKSGMTQEQIAVHFSNKWGISFKRDAVWRIAQYKEALLATNFLGKDGSKKRLREASATNLEVALYEWYMKIKAANNVVSNDALQAKAIQLAQEKPELNPKKIKFSEGWLWRFKQRWQIGSLKVRGDSGTVGPLSLETRDEITTRWTEVQNPGATLPQLTLEMTHIIGDEGIPSGEKLESAPVAVLQAKDADRANGNKPDLGLKPQRPKKVDESYYRGLQLVTDLLEWLLADSGAMHSRVRECVLCEMRDDLNMLIKGQQQDAQGTTLQLSKS